VVTIATVNGLLTLSLGDVLTLIAGRRWPTGERMTELDALALARALGAHGAGLGTLGDILETMRTLDLIDPSRQATDR
jgi:hypothetical protein